MTKVSGAGEIDEAACEGYYQTERGIYGNLNNKRQSGEIGAECFARTAGRAEHNDADIRSAARGDGSEPENNVQQVGGYRRSGDGGVSEGASDEVLRRLTPGNKTRKFFRTCHRYWSHVIQRLSPVDGKCSQAFRAP